MSVSKLTCNVIVYLCYFLSARSTLCTNFLPLNAKITGNGFLSSSIFQKLKATGPIMALVPPYLTLSKGKLACNGGCRRSAWSPPSRRSLPRASSRSWTSPENSFILTSHVGFFLHISRLTTSGVSQFKLDLTTSLISFSKSMAW